MNLSHRIQAKTDNGDLVIDFLIEVMTDERPDFKICHRLDAAKLLAKYGRDEAIDFILNNPPEPSRSRKSSGPSEESEFDIALAKKIRESTDDGASVCRFMINVMEGHLKAFGRPIPHGGSQRTPKPRLRQTCKRRIRTYVVLPLVVSGEGRNPEDLRVAPGSSLPRLRESTALLQARVSHFRRVPGRSSQTADPDPEEEQEDWARIWEEIEPIIEEAERISAEQPAT